MKLITIFQDNGPKIIVEDNDDSDLRDYSKEISRLLEFSNISILHTSSSSIVIRPSKISSIHVEEIQDEQNTVNKDEELKPDTVVVHKEEIDIITDGD